ncbi:MAG: BT4734/BF3469 family protein [Verrucomicrobiota bacterium]
MCDQIGDQAPVGVGGVQADGTATVDGVELRTMIAMPDIDFTVSVVRHALDTETTEESFRSVIGDIIRGWWKDEVDQVRSAFATGGKSAADGPKKKLPAVLFSGTFTRRAADALKQHSGLICVDLDNLGDRLPSIRESIEADPHTLTAFVSPTGSGLKVVFRCSAEKPHQASYRAAERYCLQVFGLEVDPACKDVSRLCFVSHDPETFINENAIPLPELEEAKEFTPPVAEKTVARPLSGVEPWDDYDQRVDFPNFLRSHGWKEAGRYGWTRPGKESGLSATWNKVPGRFFVFSSSTALEANHTYRPWHVFAIL